MEWSYFTSEGVNFEMSSNEWNFCGAFAFLRENLEAFWQHFNVSPTSILSFSWSVAA